MEADLKRTTTTAAKQPKPEADRSFRKRSAANSPNKESRLGPKLHYPPLLRAIWGHLTKGKFMYAKTSCSLSTVTWLGAMETKRQSRTSPAAAVHPLGHCLLNAQPGRNSTNRRQVGWMSVSPCMRKLSLYTSTSMFLKRSR